MKDDRSYCGPDFFPVWAKDTLSHYFNEECKQHDLDYENGTGRIVADSKFLYSMVKRCHAEGYGLMIYVMAFFFFFMVLFFGFLTYVRPK